MAESNEDAPLVSAEIEEQSEQQHPSRGCGNTTTTSLAGVEVVVDDEKAYDDKERLINSLEVEQGGLPRAESKREKTRRRRWWVKLSVTSLICVAALALVIHSWNTLLKSNSSLEERLEKMCHYYSPSELVQFLAPEHYNISVAFEDPTRPAVGGQKETFEGQLLLDAKVLNDSKCLALHSVNIVIKELEIINGLNKHHYQCFKGIEVEECSGKDNNIEVFSYEEMFVFVGGENGFTKGPITFNISYTASYGEDSQGFYKASLRSRAESITVSQLEREGARHAWPCIDVPKAKANFTLALQIPKGLTALSNMPLESEEESEALGLVRKTFETSPLMSTYLVALAVGNLQGISRQMSSGQNVTVWSTEEFDLGDLAIPLDLSVKALEFYQSWTDFILPLSKFDLVAVPGRTGAMENWGLLQYDEPRFLFNQQVEGYYGVLESTNVICHELAHQWFGNLVTCDNWNEIALNEGFGSAMEYKCMQALGQPSSNLLEVQLVPPSKEIRVHFPGARRHALEYDTNERSHPLVSDKTYFDAISYSKGAAVVSMVNDYADSIVPGSFQRGMQRCLSRYAYKTCTFHEMLTCSFEREHEDAAMYKMSDGDLLPWISRAGFPLLRVMEGGNSGGGVSQVFESNYSLEIEGSSKVVVDSTELAIPLRYASLDEATDKSSAVSRGSFEVLDTTLLNYGSKGFFRVLYTENFYTRLAKSLQSMKFEDLQPQMHLTLSSIIDDLFAHANNGLVHPHTVMDFVRDVIGNEAIMKEEELYNTVVPTLYALDKWKRKLHLQCESEMVDFIKGLLQPFKSSEEATDDLTRLAEAHILLLGAKYGERDFENAACEQFSLAFNTTTNSVDPNLRDAIYVARSSIKCTEDDMGKSAHQALVKCYTAENHLPGLIAERERCLYALSQSFNATLVKESIEMALSRRISQTNITSGEAKIVLRGLSRNENLDAIVQLLDAKSIGELIEILPEEGIGEILQMIAEESTLKAILNPQLSDTRKRSLENVYNGGKVWREQVGREICSWF
jgi:hypothetical protein